MYLLDALKVIARRWYIVAIGLLLLAGVAVGVTRQVSTQYQASGQMLLLLPSVATGAATPTNPYLNAPVGLTTTATLLSGSLTTMDVQRQLDAQGFSSEYSVSVLPGAGPLLVITAKGTDPIEVVATRDEVMARIDAELVRIQEEVDVPVRQGMYTSRSSVTERAEVLPGSKLRALIGVVGAGVVLILLFTFGLDRLLALRRRGPAADAPEAPAAEPLESRAPQVPTPTEKAARPTSTRGRTARTARTAPDHDAGVRAAAARADADAEAGERSSEDEPAPHRGRPVKAEEASQARRTRTRTSPAQGPVKGPATGPAKGSAKGPAKGPADGGRGAARYSEATGAKRG